MSGANCCSCQARESDESDVDEEILSPPGVMPANNEDKSLETIPLESRAESSVNLEDQLDQAKSENLENPQIVTRMQFFSMTGWNLALYPTKKVRGTREHYSTFAMLDVSAVAKGVIQMRGVETGLFLAMSRRGKLYGEEDGRKENTKWVETLSGTFYNYLSQKYAHTGWYLGLKKNGKPKRAHRTEYGQRAIQFLHRHPYPIS